MSSSQGGGPSTSVNTPPDGLPLDPADDPQGATRTQLPAGSDATPVGPADGGAPLPLPPGSPARVGRFEVRAFVGEGVFGRVYEAYDPSLKRGVALKLAKTEQLTDPGRVLRFQREARAAAALTHPHIVGVFDAGQDGPHHYIAATFVRGRSLEAALRARHETGPLPEAEAAALARKLPEALDYAHRLGVIHRDAKPANVLIDERGEPLLADFGVAVRADDEGQTQEGKALGTPGYMAPEQWQGRACAASDQYSLGCVLFELLTGHLPFTGRDLGHFMFLHMREPPPSPRGSRAGLARDLETICLKCLEKDPGKRYATCGELAEDLRRWHQGEPIRARRVGPAERLTRWARRNPLLACLTAAAALLLAVGSLVSWGFAAWALDEKKHANKQEDIAHTKEVEATASAAVAKDARAKEQQKAAEALAKATEAREARQQAETNFKDAQA